MKRLILLFLFLPCLAWANPYILDYQKEESSTVTYLINQNFEGPGYDNNENWIESNGDPDPDYAAAPAPLRGSYSLLMQQSGSDRLTSPSFTPTSTLYTHFLLNYNDLSNANDTTFDFQLSDGTSIFQVYAYNGAIGIRVKGANGDRFTKTSGVTYHIWVDITYDGSDMGCKLYINTSTTKPTTADGIYSIENEEDLISKFYLRPSGTDAEYIIDQILSSTTEFTSVD